MGGLLLAAAAFCYAFVQLRIITRRGAVEREAKPPAETKREGQMKAGRPDLHISVDKQQTYVMGTVVQYAEMLLEVTNFGTQVADGFEWVLTLEPQMREQVEFRGEDGGALFPEIGATEHGYSPLFREASARRVPPGAYIPIGRMNILPTNGKLPSFTISSRVMHDEHRTKPLDKIHLMNVGNNNYIIRCELGRSEG